MLIVVNNPIYGFNRTDFCLYKSKFHCNVYLKHHRNPLELERLTVPF